MELIKEAQPSKTFDRLNLPQPPLEGREGRGDTELTGAGLINAPSVPSSNYPLVPEKTQDILQTVLRRYRMWAFTLRKDTPALKFAKSCALYCKEALSNIINFSFIPPLFYGTRRLFSSLSFKNLSISLLIPAVLFSSLYVNTDNSYSAPVLPAGGSFVYGTGSVSSASGLMTITQSTPKAVINWQGFSIGANGEVFINNAGGATLNRVVGPNISSIAGLLKSTGSVFLINPNGIVITPTGSVITGGSFLASTLNISDSNFINSNYSFSGKGSVTNEGTINSQGKVILVGQFVNNSGSITSQSSASLISGSLVLIAPSGIMVSPSKGSVTNTGAIKAASAYLTSAGGNVYALSGNTQGIIEATGSKTINGQIWLTAPQGTVSVNSKLQADSSITIFGNNTLVGPSSLISVSGNGTIDVGLDKTKSLNTDISSGASFSTGDNGLLDTSGENLSIGNINVYVPNGQWLLDPTDFTVDSSNNSAIDTALGSGNVTITTTASSASATSPITNGTSNTGTTGSIDIDAPLSWSSLKTLTLSAYDSINIDSTITISGGGGLVLTYNTGGLSPSGTLNFPLTPSGFTGSVEFTKGTSSSGGSAAAPSGSLTINGTGYTLVNDYNLYSAVNGALSGDYALATNITAPSSFTPIGETTPFFTGTFNGLGNTVNNLDIGLSSAYSSDMYAGLFGRVGFGGTVENLGVTNVSIYDNGVAVGGLVGLNDGDVGGNAGTVKNSYATGSVSGTGSSSSAGGLVGWNSGGTVSSSYATVNVSGSSSAVGGLVGANSSATVTNSYATGSVGGTGYIGGLVGYNFSGSVITNSYAAVSVSGGSGSYSYIGGLVGYNYGTVSDSYATGSVSGTGSSSVGGLVGFNSGGTVSNSYATGSVSGTGSTVGGLVGVNSSTVSNSYWDTTTTSSPIAGIGWGTNSGATGLSKTAMEQYTNFSGFNIYDPDTGTGSYTNNSGNSVWIQYNGHSFPLLRVFMNTLTVTANNTTTYNGSAYTAPPSGVTYSPSPYNASEVSGTLSYWDDATNSAPVNVGTYGLLPGLYSTSQNGYIMIYNGTLTINKAPLTVTANNDTITYNGSAFTGGNGLTYSGFVGGQNSLVLSGTPIYSGSSQGAVNAGTYTIIPSGLTDSNYTITYVNGALTIKQATFPDLFQAIYNQTGYSGKAAIVYESLSSYYASGGTTGGTSRLLPYTGTGRGVIINGIYKKIRFFSIAKEKNGGRSIKLFY
jgi:filamentous hemagglutinin family protein